MDAAQHIVKLGPCAVELVDRTMIELSRAIPAFAPTINAFVRGEPHARIDCRAVQEKRDAASACHASQLMAPPSRGVMGRVMRLFGGKEMYMRAYPAVDGRLKESDLFAGVS